MILCGCVVDQSLRARLLGILRPTGWTCHFADTIDALKRVLSGLDKEPDVLLAEDAETLTAFLRRGPVRIVLAIDEPAGPATWLSPSLDDLELLQQISTAVNVARFQTQFSAMDRTEPITKLPRHDELLRLLSEHPAEPSGLLLVEVDHADHLYATLDPVSKTDLLSALGEHLQALLPDSARLGFYDAACFAIVELSGEAQRTEALAHRLVAGMRRPLLYQSGEIHVTVSVGWDFSNNSGQPETLWRNAWAAKVKASRSGGDRITQAHRSDLSERLPDALAREDFSLVLQPQWRAADQNISGVEALLRWQDMEIGALAPSHFIPVAEQSGHIARIGDWVLERAATASATWFEHLVNPLVLALNVSVQQFNNDAISKQISRLRDENWLDPGIVELELPQEQMLQLLDKHRSQVYRLRDQGVRFALDNLGRSVIDTNRLLRCPADTLKIDRSIVARLDKDPTAVTLVDEICQLATRFGLRSVAVGVETESQFDLLLRCGCSDVQGYLFAEPVNLAEFQNLIQQRAGRIAQHSG